MGYGVVAGAKYKLADKVYANGGLEYNRLGSFDDTKVNNYGAKSGRRLRILISLLKSAVDFHRTFSFGCENLYRANLFVINSCSSYNPRSK